MVGQVAGTHKMNHSEKNKINQIVKLLKFIIQLDDLEVIKTSIESIIESLEENDSEK